MLSNSRRILSLCLHGYGEDQVYCSDGHCYSTLCHWTSSRTAARQRYVEALSFRNQLECYLCIACSPLYQIPQWQHFVVWPLYHHTPYTSCRAFPPLYSSAISAWF